jgi:uncharacterized RDD family membrane protein YckC
LAYDSPLGRVQLGLFLLAWPCVYSVLLTDREGRTLGQRTQGIRTVTRDDEAPTRRKLLLRVLAIWGPIALGMSLQTDWPPAALALGVLGVKALIVSDIPWLLVQLWIMALLLMPHLQRKGRHVADILSRTQIVEIRRPWRELTGGAKHRGWHASSLISRRSLIRTPVLFVWLSFAAFVVQQLSGLPGDFVEPGRLRVREPVVAGQPGWDRLIAKFGNEYLGRGDQMENPEVLPLQRGLFFHLIYTSTPPSNPLWIANRLFGSKRKLFMKDATALRGKKWGGNRTAHTAALAPSSPDEAATWKEARWNSYHGSDMHFLRALMHERLKEEGFEVMNPEDFQGLFRQEKRFLLVAKGRLQVRVAGDPTVESINLPSGFVRVNNFGYLDGHWGGGWGQDPVPSFVIKGYAEEQDRLWGKATETIERVLSLE